MISSLGILPANRRSVQEAASVLPSLRSTIAGWFQPLILSRVTKTIVDREVKEVARVQQCFGVIQPFSPRQLTIKPEGQRSWIWKMLHTTPDVNLNPDEEFTIRGTRYRVMSQNGYDEYGYIQYELVQDYQGG